MNISKLLIALLFSVLLAASVNAQDVNESNSCEIKYDSCTEKCENTEGVSIECFQKCEDAYNKCVDLDEENKAKKEK